MSKLERHSLSFDTRADYRNKIQKHILKGIKVKEKKLKIKSDHYTLWACRYHILLHVLMIRLMLWDFQSKIPEVRCHCHCITKGIYTTHVTSMLMLTLITCLKCSLLGFSLVSCSYCMHSLERDNHGYPHFRSRQVCPNSLRTEYKQIIWYPLCGGFLLLIHLTF